MVGGIDAEVKSCVFKSWEMTFFKKTLTFAGHCLVLATLLLLQFLLGTRVSSLRASGICFRKAKILFL